MRLQGFFNKLKRNTDGDLIIEFKVSGDLDGLDDLKDKLLVISVKKLRENRSLNANGYLWSLLDKIGKAIRVNKWSVYLMELSRWGIFTDLIVKSDAIPDLKKAFRLVEVFDEGYEPGEMVMLRCYYGSSGYDTKEFSELLEGVITDAKSLNIDTPTEDEKRHLIELWEQYRSSKKI